MQVVKGFQIKQDNGDTIFVSADEVDPSANPIASAKEREWIRTHFMRKTEPVENYRLDVFKLLLIVGLILLFICLGVLLIQREGLLIGLLATSSIVIGFSVFCMFGRFMFSDDFGGL